MLRGLLLLVTLFGSLTARAQLIAMRDSVPESYNFWLYLPDEGVARKPIVSEVLRKHRYEAIISDTRRIDSLLGFRTTRTICQSDTTDTTSRTLRPIILFLHGRSLCGTDLYRVRRYGCLDALAMGREIDAVIIAPQNRGDGWWSPERLMRIIDWVESRYEVDGSRLYVLGMSLGGYGTLDFAATYPDRTAAAIALCGGASRKDLSGLNRVPLWIIHGTADRLVPVRESRRVKEQMEQQDETSLLRYDELKGINHALLARVFYLNETYEWLFSHSIDRPDRSLSLAQSISIDRIRKPYTGLRRGSVQLQVLDPRRAAGVINDPDIVYHVVRSGDTLGAIALKHGTSVARLCQANGITSTSILRIGQRIRIE